MKTEDERWEYSQRLMSRMTDRIVEASPTDVGLADVLGSDEMAPANSSLEEALSAWDQGVIDKAELDQKAAGYLKHWREVVQAWQR